jgi:DNA-directed RNA polymerase specialized sigma24 family protein
MVRYKYNFDNFSDADWIDHLIKNDPDAIVSFFYKKQRKIFAHNLHKVFSYKVDLLDYINEFFLYLEASDWKRLKTFQSEYSLTTWISVVSYRFFKNYKLSMIDSRGLITITDKWDSQTEEWVLQSDFGLRKDIMKAINQISNERDRKIANLLFIEDRASEEVAQQFGLTVDYLYTIKNRIIKALRIFLKEYNHE